MANSKIIIQFTQVPDINSVLRISETTASINLLETFKKSRLASFQTKIPQLNLEDDTYSEYISNNYQSALNMDYNTSGLFTIYRSDGIIGSGIGTVTIEANYPNAIFSVITDTTTDTIITIENATAVPPFTIDEVEFTPQIGFESTRCTINTTTNHLATKLLQPFVVNPNVDNPIIFTAYRAMTFNLEVEDSNGLRALQIVKTPAYLNIDNFTLTVNNSPNGATMIVTYINSDGLDLQYSLDNINWQTSNIFSGLDVDTFMFWVKDQLGDKKSKNFTVNEFGIYTPYFYISKSNSIRYANRITWGDSENYKTDENTLSFEVDVDCPYKEVQQFQSADTPTTQFKSNFNTNIATIIKEDLSEIDIPVAKMTTNIGIKDKRDARKYDLGDGRTGVYFLAGNIYNYDTDAITGTYALNGLLPEWGIVGNYIMISNAWFLIEEVVFDENKNSDIIVFSENYTGPEIDIIAGSIFNRFNYEVYEFTIDMVDYIEQKFNVRLVNSDPHFATITHLSEELWCKVKHEDVLEILYYNTTNTDVFYATGIQHKIRIPITNQKGVLDEESEIHKTDTDAILLNADLYEGDSFIFEPVTKEIWRKVMIALSHEKVWLNGVGYAKNGNFNTEGPLEKSNLYVLTANMLKTGSVYNSQGSGNLDYDGTAVEVPGLIQTDSGYVSY